MERDEDIRTSCFSRLAILQAQYGDELPFEGVLALGFPFRGQRVPFLNRQKGIYRARVQRGRAALSIQTSYKGPYGDSETELGFLYAYRTGSIDQPGNAALRAAHRAAVPIVYFFATQRGWYQPFYPCFVTEDDPVNKQVLVSKGKMIGAIDDPEPVLIEDPIERRYVKREVRVRMHQGRFRGVVLPAYGEQCAICRLKEAQLLDAAHIVGDALTEGAARITNGLSLCTIHHRAFDKNLVGISPGYEVHVAPRLLEDEDGPMLDVLKGFDGTSIHLPRRRAWLPDRERLETRFERFLAVA
jgi:putative restriction endonuclease